MRLGPPERRKPQLGQADLQLAEIKPAEGQIVQQVSRAVAVADVNLIDAWLRLDRRRDHLRTNGGEFLEDWLAFLVHLAELVSCGSASLRGARLRGGAHRLVWRAMIEGHEWKDMNGRT